ncbi:hypothetical protein Ddye_027848 [Dipteronia dyeriana]|uniref:Oleosin n=1 Tax=Dipteronia dyeriana TaxID=168575 RepID=A0AAD9WRU4_9ROSI|nr:hypothetical protein Ddye_027848 [Dipteronia dyeriana]
MNITACCEFLTKDKTKLVLTQVINTPHLATNGQQLTTHGHGGVTGKSVVYKTLGCGGGGPFFGMLGFSLLATLTLLVCFPFMLLFSPLLLCVSLLFVGALAGFSTVGTMAVAGVSTLSWSYREVVGGVW